MLAREHPQHVPFIYLGYIPANSFLLSLYFVSNFKSQLHVSSIWKQVYKLLNVLCK